MATLRPIGLDGLIHEFQLRMEPPAVRSQAGQTTRKTVIYRTLVEETYTKRHICRTLVDHLRFSFRYEPLDLRVWKAVLDAMPPREIADWVRAEPTSYHSRRAWYLYERLTGKTLDLPDTATGAYALVADGTLQHVWTSTSKPLSGSKRHRVYNNLLGSAPTYCPLIRHTRKLTDHQNRDYRGRIATVAALADPAMFRRVAHFLYLTETKSSYAIERETPSKDREERYVQCLERAGAVDVASEAGLVELQRLIIQDPRFAASSWRTVQNYVGRTRHDGSEDVRYPCPKPSDLAELMAGWSLMIDRIHHADQSDPVVMAACAAFGFVYLHPFEDGNGRIHRFLIHHVLAQREYNPPGVIFPVSAAILRRRDEYDTVLESISALIRPLVEWDLDDYNRMTVTNDTIEAYRYPDLTAHAEFLYDCIEETVEKDWPDELRFLSRFDQATAAVQAVVDMPDNRLRLLLKLLFQNNGQLSQAKRPLFDYLTDAEIASIEERVTTILALDPLADLRTN